MSRALERLLRVKGERGHKQPYRVCLEDNDPFAFAGLWNRWEHNGDTLETVTIITTDPNDVVEPIHDRMPAILEPDQECEWLEAAPDCAQDLLGPYEGGDLRAYPISTQVNDPANDTPDVLVEVDQQKQTGLGEVTTLTFFMKAMYCSFEFRKSPPVYTIVDLE